MTDEEYVRSVWERIYVRSKGLYAEGFGKFSSDRNGWSAFAVFTRERLEQIRQVEEEVKLLERMFRFSVRGTDEHPTCERILAREQAALAELKQGMKDQEIV